MTERARVIGGARAADELVAGLASEVAKFTQATDIVPCLALVAIDDDPAQRLYVRKKVIAGQQAGVRTVTCPLNAASTTEQVLEAIRRLNADPKVHGIFVQWPLPDRVDLDKVVASLAPEKDIDGMGSAHFVPAAALASLRLLRLATPDVANLNAVVACESVVFAKPMARLLLDAKCAVTLLTRNNNELASACRRAQVLITALGAAELIRGDWIQAGATVIDASVNAIANEDGALRYVGDVKFDEAVQVAGAITPVPGGVGPMTVACLLENTLAAARRHARLKR